MLEKAPCIVAVLGDATRERFQAVVFAFVVQFVQQIDANDFTVGLALGQLLRQAVGPIEHMGFQQHSTPVYVVGVKRGSYAQIGHAHERLLGQSRYLDSKDAAGGRFPMGEAQVQCAEAVLRAVCAGTQGAPQLAAMHHMA